MNYAGLPGGHSVEGAKHSPPGDLQTRARQWLFWCLPALAAGLGLWLSFPPVGWSWLAWFALVPLATAVRTPWRARPIYRPAWAGGLVFGLLAVQWIRYADSTSMSGYYGWLALAAYMSAYFPLFLLICRMAVLRFRVPCILAVPTVWVGLEYLRCWMLTGFPWYYLAHTQYQWITLIQVSSVTGAYGVSFLVAAVNGWLVDVATLPLLRPTLAGPRLTAAQGWRLGVMAALLAATLAYGRSSLSRQTNLPGPRVALIQSNIAQQVKEDDAMVEQVYQQYLRLLDQAAPRKPDLVIMPETAYRMPLVTIEQGVTDEDMRRQYPDESFDPQLVREIEKDVRADLVNISRRVGAPLLLGINSEIFQEPGSRRYNTALVVDPDRGLSAPYHKLHLVPWGEYLPLKDWMPWLHIFTPHASADYGLSPGTEQVRFQVGEHSFGVLICFEDTLPWASRSLMTDPSVDMLVNISNDGWFGVADESTGEVSLWQRAEHEAHLASSVFRAVECRRPLVRSVNTGISAIVDASGRIVRAAGDDTGRHMTSQVLVAEVPLDRRASFYAQVGDWLGVSAHVATLACLIAGFGSAVSRRGTGSVAV